MQLPAVVQILCVLQNICNGLHIQISRQEDSPLSGQFQSPQRFPAKPFCHRVQFPWCGCSTAVQHNAPVTWVVLDNRSLGWIKFGQKRLGERYIATDYSAQPDFALLARACGCYGENVTRPEKVRGALERALRANAEGQPAVIAFTVDGETYAEGFHAYYALKDG